VGSRHVGEEVGGVGAHGGLRRWRLSTTKEKRSRHGGGWTACVSHGVAVGDDAWLACLEVGRQHEGVFGCGGEER